MVLIHSRLTMETLFWKIVLFIFIKCFIVCGTNGALNTPLHEEPSASNDEVIENVPIEGTTAPLIIGGTPEQTTVITVIGTIKDIKFLVHNKTISVITPVLVNATLDKLKYLLINKTENDKTNILVYMAIDNSTIYLLTGVLQHPGVNSDGFIANTLQDVIDVLPKNSSEVQDDPHLEPSPVNDLHNLNFTKPPLHNGDFIEKFVINVEDAIKIVCPRVYVKYYIYKRSDSETNDKGKPQFDSSKKTTILIHGWTNNGLEPHKFSQRLKNAILKTDDRNVIVVSWTATHVYPCALASMKPVGNKIARLVNKLIQVYKVDSDSFHLMGHSLGGHVVGYVGDGMKIIPDNITSFDPAHPMISCSDPKDCVHKDAAGFVVVIHTDGGRTAKEQPLGDVDFYPNGGEHTQPGCDPEKVLTSCSHAAGFKFYESAILSGSNGTIFYAAKSDSYEDFKNGKCTGKNVFGPNIKEEPNGKFYFMTSGTPPYALGKEGMSESCWAAIQ